MSRIKNAYNILEQFFDSLLSIIVAFARINQAFESVPSVDSKPVLILGNGPSAKDAIESIIPVRDKFLIGCVNDFYKQSAFYDLKPDFYFICDPMYWISETYSIYGEPLWNELRRINWPMKLFIPYNARNTFKNKTNINTHINIYFYNTTKAGGYKFLKKIFYSFGLGMPLPQNVIVAALFILMKGGAKKIYISGVEHSWHQSLYLSENNELYVMHDNGASNSRELQPFYKIHGKKLLTVCEVFSAWASVHKSYVELQSWSIDINARVENITPNTFIDAFPRSTLKMMLNQNS